MYALPKRFINKQRELGVNAEWFCPRGDRLHFKTSLSQDIQREKEESERRLQAQLNEANHARLVAERERDRVVKDKRKVERRIAHGVCPCCNKSFTDVANHMLTEHKEFRLPAGRKQKLLTA